MCIYIFVAFHLLLRNGLHFSSIFYFSLGVDWHVFILIRFVEMNRKYLKSHDGTEAVCVLCC